MRPRPDFQSIRFQLIQCWDTLCHRPSVAPCLQRPSARLSLVSQQQRLLGAPSLWAAPRGQGREQNGSRITQQTKGCRRGCSPVTARLGLRQALAPVPHPHLSRRQVLRLQGDPAPGPRMGRRETVGPCGGTRPTTACSKTSLLAL